MHSVSGLNQQYNFGSLCFNANHFYFILSLETVPSTASENDDYVPRRVNVTFEPGQTTKTVKFDIIDDNLVEETEEFKVAVVYSSVPAVTWGDPVSVNIQDNDGIYYVLAPYCFDFK